LRVWRGRAVASGCVVGLGQAVLEGLVLLQHLGLLSSTHAKVMSMRRGNLKGGHGRRLDPLIGISSFQVLAMFRRGLFYTFLSIYLRFFLGLTVTETTFFATFPMIVNVLSQTFVWGRISDRSQKRRTLIILGEMCAAVTTFMVWVVHRIPETHHAAGYVIIIGMSVVEIFWSMSNIGWSALISDLYPERERTSVQGRLASIGAGGRLAGVWIGGLAYDGLGRFYEGWGFEHGLLFFIASGVMVISTIPMFFVPEGGVPPERRSPFPIQPADARPAGPPAYSKKFLLFLLALVFINFGRNSITMMKAQYLVLDDGFNVASGMLSHIVNMQSAAVLLGGLAMRRLSKRFSDEVLLLAGAVIAVLGLVGFVLARALTQVFVSNFLNGLADVGILAVSYSYASRLIPPLYRGRQFSLFDATTFLSWGVAGTLLGGPIVDYLLRSGAGQVFAYRMSFVAAAVLVSVGILVLVFVNRMEDPRATRSAHYVP
jgi:MFS family permease